MWDILKTRWQQGHRTQAFPPSGTLPERFRGRPMLDASRCATDCTACRDACPTDAITLAPLTLDLGRCTFCPACTEACPTGAIQWTPDYRLATRTRDDLRVRNATHRLAGALDAKMRALFGRSLKLRQVSAGGCNGCEQELQALNNVVFDLSRFGIQFVASPRHADGLVITGPVTAAMGLALQKTYEAVPDPKLVIAVGACAISGGAFRGSPVCRDGAASTVPVDLFIPGCPPHPLTILDGLLRLLGRVDAGRERAAG